MRGIHTQAESSLFKKAVFVGKNQNKEVGM